MVPQLALNKRDKYKVSFEDMLDSVFVNKQINNTQWQLNTSSGFYVPIVS